jgi:hypothetical protein
MSEKVINMENETNENMDEILNENIEGTSEEIMGDIAVDEELKRIVIQDKPISKLSKDTKNGIVYKEIIEQTEVLGACFQMLLGYGVDYASSLTIAQNMITNRVETEKIKIQNVLTQTL